MDRFVRCIHIEGRSIEDIMRLPCVRSCQKTAVCGICKYGFFPTLMAHPAPYQSAYTGDWICEDENGKYHVLNDDQYRKL